MSRKKKARKAKPAKVRKVHKPAPTPPRPRVVHKERPVSKKRKSKKATVRKSGHKRKSGKRAVVRRGGLSGVSARGFVPAGTLTQVAGGIAGIALTGFAVETVAGRVKPGSTLAFLQNRWANIGARAVLAIGAGWLLRRFASRSLGSAVLAGGLTGAALKAVSGARLGSFQVPQLVGLGNAGDNPMVAAGVDWLRPNAPVSLGDLTDGQIQDMVNQARADAGNGNANGGMRQLGDNSFGGYVPTEGDATPGVLARIAAAGAA